MDFPLVLQRLGISRASLELLGDSWMPRGPLLSAPGIFQSCRGAGLDRDLPEMVAEWAEPQGEG
eukprot:3716852-Pyramimonas_sp.AAC.1